MMTFNLPLCLCWRIQIIYRCYQPWASVPRTKSSHAFNYYIFLLKKMDFHTLEILFFDGEQDSATLWKPRPGEGCWAGHSFWARPAEAVLNCCHKDRLETIAPGLVLLLQVRYKDLAVSRNGRSSASNIY